MPGNTYRIPKRMYDFSGLGTGASAVIPMATGLDMSMYREVVVVVRFHLNPTNWTNTQVFTVSARLDAPTPEDPGTEFFGTVDLGSVAMFTQGTDTAPAVKFFTLLNAATGTSNLPATIRIVIKGTGGSAPATFQVAVSVDVTGRS